MATRQKMSRWDILLQIVIFSTGFFYAFTYYVKVSEPVDLQAIADNSLAYLTAMVITAFAIGIINLTRIHYRNIRLKRPDWKFSVVLVGSLYGMAIFSMIASPFALDPQAIIIPSSLIDAIQPIWRFLYYNIFVSINTSIFSLLAFFIASAAYRAFKVRTVESTILLIAGLLVIIGEAPISDLIWPGFSAIHDWIMLVPNTAGQRGILIGAALSIIVFSVRRMIRYQ
jgi:hypothetical protein